jgi:hypothetical protein
MYIRSFFLFVNPHNPPSRPSCLGRYFPTIKSKCSRSRILVKSHPRENHCRPLVSLNFATACPIFRFSRIVNASTNRRASHPFPQNFEAPHVHAGIPNEIKTCTCVPVAARACSRTFRSTAISSTTREITFRTSPENRAGSCRALSARHLASRSLVFCNPCPRCTYPRGFPSLHDRYACIVIK